MLLKTWDVYLEIDGGNDSMASPLNYQMKWISQTNVEMI